MLERPLAFALLLVGLAFLTHALNDELRVEALEPDLAPALTERETEERAVPSDEERRRSRPRLLKPPAKKRALLGIPG